MGLLYVASSMEFRYAHQLKIGDFFRRIQDGDVVPDQTMGYRRRYENDNDFEGTWVVLVNRDDQPHEIEFDDEYEIVEYCRDVDPIYAA